MLRQVAYDTLSRRDRKARHLAVAAHLRAAFPGDGEEVTDVIARHYLDALKAVPDDPDAGEIRGQAIAALIRAAERAERTGAPAQAAASYAAAAELTQAGRRRRAADGRPAVGTRRGRRRHQRRLGRGRRARRPGPRLYLPRGEARAPPAPRPSPGGRCAGGAATPRPASSSPPPSRCCGHDPDTDTVRALNELAALEVFAGAPDADRSPPRRSPSARTSDVGRRHPRRPVHHPGDLAQLRRPTARGGRLPPRGRAARRAGRRQRPPGSRAGQPGGRDGRHRPRAGAEAARAAAGHLRRAGARDFLAFAILNLAQALLMTRRLGRRRRRAHPGRRCRRPGRHRIPRLLPGLAGGAARRHRHRPGDARGAAETCGPAKTRRTGRWSASWRPSSPPPAASRGRAPPRPRHVLAHADAIGISHEYIRWAWPLAARAAQDLGDTAAIRELLALLDPTSPGTLAPMLRAERDLARARLAAATVTRPPPRPSPPRSAACASSARPTTSPMACSTTPSTSPACGDTGAAAAGHRRSPDHRPTAALPAAAGPGRGHGARRIPDTGLNDRATGSAGVRSRRRPGRPPTERTICCCRCRSAAARSAGARQRLATAYGAPAGHARRCPMRTRAGICAVRAGPGRS